MKLLTLPSNSIKAGVSISKMIDIFREYDIEANLEYEDYLKSLKTAGKIW